MNPTPAPRGNSDLLGLLGIVILLALGAAFYEYTAAKRAEASLAVETRTHEADQARMQQLAKKVTDAAQRQADLERTLQQSRLAGGAARPPGNPEAGGNARAQALADGQAFMAAYGAQAHDMLLAIGKAQVARNFAALIESGAITPAQIEELERQTAEHWVDTIAVTPNSVHPTDPNLPDDQVKAILGDQGFQQFQNYQRMQPLQGLVNDISSLAFATPLTPGQSTQLLNVLANSSDNYASGGKATPNSVDWNQVLPQAQGILSESQLSALKAEAQLPQIMSLIKQFYQNPPPAK